MLTAMTPASPAPVYVSIAFTSTNEEVMYTVPDGKVLTGSIITNNQYACAINGDTLLTPSTGRVFPEIAYPAGTVFSSITSGNSTRFFGLLTDA